MKIIWRKCPNSPLLIVGRCTLWFTNGISFGVSHNYGDTCYYVGWLLVNRRHRCLADWINDKKNRPKDWMWTLRCGR